MWCVYDIGGADPPLGVERRALMCLLITLGLLVTLGGNLDTDPRGPTVAETRVTDVALPVP